MKRFFFRTVIGKSFRVTNLTSFFRYAAMPSAAPYGQFAPMPFYPDQAHLFAARDARYQAPIAAYDWHPMMNHDRSEYHRDYERRPPPTSNT